MYAYFIFNKHCLKLSLLSFVSLFAFATFQNWDFPIPTQDFFVLVSTFVDNKRYTAKTNILVHSTTRARK